MTNEKRHEYLQGKLADAHFQHVFESRTGSPKGVGGFTYLLQLNSRIVNCGVREKTNKMQQLDVYF